MNRPTPTKKVERLTSWSYSRYRDHKRCPAFAKYKHIDKLKEPGNKAMDRGSDIGKKAEDYVLGRIKALPVELSLFKEHFAAVRELKGRNVFVEEQWTLTDQWEAMDHQFPQDKEGGLDFNRFKPADWQAWRSIWLRVKMDLCGVDEEVNVLVPVDHKTGKYREYEMASYLEQLEIYAIAGMIKFPDTVGASPRLWFLDEGIEYPQVNGDELFYSRAELPRLIKLWTQKTKPMFTDTAFKPTPNSKCQYCYFRKANGGPCKY